MLRYTVIYKVNWWFGLGGVKVGFKVRRCRVSSVCECVV